MNRVFLAVAFVTAMALAACAGQNPLAISQAQEIDSTCAVAATVISSLADANTAGKLSADDVANTKLAIAIVDPVCNAPTRPTLTQAAYESFTSAVYSLQSLAVAKKGN